MKILSKNIAIGGLNKVILGSFLLAGLVSCTENPNSPGLEVMPDMYRPQSYEAYLEKYDIDSAQFFEKNIKKLAVDFNSLNEKEKQDVINDISAVYSVWKLGSATKKPVKGSIARDKKPFLIAKENRDLAKSLVNPIEANEDHLKEGKAYYEIFCDHCHGEKGDGNGPMIQLGVYPAQPPSYSAGASADLSAGEIYHTIYHGKGVMGSHASQISEDKRWKIVLYVQKLQGKQVGPVVAESDTTALDSTK